MQLILTPAVLGVPGDANGDGKVDMADMIRITDWWTITFCELLNDCNGADMTGPEGALDGVVDLYDFSLLAAHWLEADAIY